MSKIMDPVKSEELSAAKDNSLAKIAEYKAAYYDDTVDRSGLKDAANSAIKALGQWIDLLQELNGQLHTAGQLLTEMMLGEYDPHRKPN